jgi:hypothetical protein
MTIRTLWKLASTKLAALPRTEWNEMDVALVAVAKGKKRIRLLFKFLLLLQTVNVNG